MRQGKNKQVNLTMIKKNQKGLGGGTVCALRAPSSFDYYFDVKIKKKVSQVEQFKEK